MATANKNINVIWIVAGVIFLLLLLAIIIGAVIRPRYFVRRGFRRPFVVRPRRPSLIIRE